jgi:opacity protein-like surface antigen
MMSVKSLFGAVACVTVLATSSIAASAQPNWKLSPPSATASQTAVVEQVQYRGRGGYRGQGGNRRGGGGGGIAIGLGAAIIGGIILSEAARAEHRSNSGDWERCAQTYRSFEQSTGMYTGYDGERHTCPYLR